MLIVIEGCVGVGKSTVARGLAGLRGGDVLLENFESNPFLRDFSRDPVANALETEFAFLLLHFHQTKNISVTEDSQTIADFHLGKDLLYADLNLSDVRAKRIFTELYDLCSSRTPAPSLMICLSATTDLVLQRIRLRNRDFELELDADYYTRLNGAYEDFFAQYRGKKLRVNMDAWDFIKDHQLYERLSALVDQELNTK